MTLGEIKEACAAVMVALGDRKITAKESNTVIRAIDQWIALHKLHLPSRTTTSTAETANRRFGRTPLAAGRTDGT